MAKRGTKPKQAPEGAPAPAAAPPSPTPLSQPPEGRAPGMTEVLLPRALRNSGAWRWWRGLPEERRQLAAVVAWAAVVVIPFLGSVGLWDPWETHYAEVARSMIERGDFIHPFWERAYFFSKPVLPMWMMAAGMLVVDALHGPAGAMSVYTEWAVRMPFALLSIWGVTAAYLAGARVFSRRVGLLAAFVLSTMPFWFLIARQAMTDMPLVALMSSALFCFMVAVFGRKHPDDAPSAPWLYAFYVLVGLATLAKGLLGFALPGAVILLWLVLTNEWKLLLRLRIPSGALVFLAVAAPWYVAMILFEGRDEEFKTFWQRFFIHDHFNRLGRGVHTTTPGGTFTYFIEQLGFGAFPWVLVLPGTLVTIARLTGDAPQADGETRPEAGAARAPRDLKRQALVFVLGWLVLTWVLFSLSSTKFHHYALPMIPPLAMLVALHLDDLWEGGLSKWRGLLLVGVALFVVVAQNLVLDAKHLIDLFVYNYERPYPYAQVNPRWVFAAGFAAAGVVIIAGWLKRSRRVVFGTLFGLAAAFALYVSWVHWTALSFHWSQRDIFWTYYQDRPSDDAPIAAYYMNWRGETFYSQNHVRQIKNAADLRAFVKPEGPEYVVVEQSRYKGMRSVLSRYRLRILDRSNNKFYLVRVDDPQ